MILNEWYLSHKNYKSVYIITLWLNNLKKNIKIESSNYFYLSWLYLEIFLDKTTEIMIFRRHFNYLEENGNNLNCYQNNNKLTYSD